MPVRAGVKAKGGLPHWRNLLVQLAVVCFGYLFAKQLSPYNIEFISRLRETLPSPPNIGATLTYTSVPLTGLECVRIMAGEKSDNFSDFVLLNQPAILLASYYNTKLAFPKIGVDSATSKMGKFFDKCGAVQDNSFPEKCVLKMEDAFYNYCPPGSCDCMANELAANVQHIVAKGCSTVGVLGDGYPRWEFSGCLKALKKRLGSTGKRPSWQYDAIQYHSGDLRNTTEYRTPQTPGLDLWLVLKQFCMLSDRDIVVIVEEQMELPVCGDRVIQAKVSELEAMQIMQHARFVSVGVRDIAHVLMEFAQPERFIMDLENTKMFEYVACENWTLVDVRDGSTFHYEDKQYLVEIMTSTRNLQQERKYRKPEKLTAEMFEMAMPSRRWSAEMMKPAVLRTT